MLIKGHPNAHYANLISDCRSLMEAFEDCRLMHCYREANGVDDVLAKRSLLNTHFLLDVLDSPPPFVLSSLFFDVMGFGVNRCVPLVRTL